MRVLLAVAALALAAEGTVDVWLKHGATEAELYAKLVSVSDPRSPAYGDFLSAAEVANLLAVDRTGADALLTHLRAGAADPSRVSLVATGDRIVLEDAAAKPELPARFAALVRKVVLRTEAQPGTPAHDGLLHARSNVRASGPPYGAPEVRTAYGMPASAVGAGQTQLVWGPGTYGVLTTDVEKYWRSFGINNTLDRLQRTGYANASSSGDNFGEASLDTDIVSGMAPGAVTVVSNTNKSHAPEEGPGFGYAEAAFLNGLVSQTELPGVVSLSLGSLTYRSCVILCDGVAKSGAATYAACLKHIQYEERQVCMFSNNDVIETANVEFLKLGLRGVTVLAAAGDGGMHFSFQPFDQGSALGAALNKVACAHAMPTFPASSPYVTSVGGNTWPQSDPAKAQYWPGGGSSFSWDFAMPEYQKTAVHTYIANHKDDKNFAPASQYNISMRAYPDVSALASGNAMVDDGLLRAAGGTSAAAPTFAGVITALNGARVCRDRVFTFTFYPRPSAGSCR